MVAVQYARTDDGVNIAYTVEHNGPGTPIMCALTSFENVETRSSMPQPLYDGRTTITFDPRCQGLSDRRVEDISLSARALDFLAVQRAAGAEEVAILAIGQQVWPAIFYAFERRDSVSHLLFINPSASGDDFWNGTALGTFREVAKASYEVFTESWAWLLFERTGVDSERIRAAAARGRETLDELGFRRLHEADMEIDVSHELSQLSCNVLVSAAKDLLGNREVSRRFAAHIPNARLISPPVLEQFPALARFLDGDDHFPSRPAVEPSPGLRSILFTDIEGHTEMMARLGDERGREVLRQHERITREALAEYGGTEVKAMGDGFMSWFPSATAALKCASSLQKAFEHHSEGGEPIRIRAGINAGEPMEEDEDLFGTSVIVAARTAASANGGQIVVTDVVRQLVAGKEFLFADRGLSNLKGFEDPVRTWEVLW